MNSTTREEYRTIDALLSSESNEWYTPSAIIDRVRQIGPIGLDPASNSIAQEWIKAERWYDKERNAFTQSWKTEKGLWLNPPFGIKSASNPGAGAWILKAIAEYRAGSFPWAVLLVRGDSEGVKALEAIAVSCEPYKRIAFISPTDPTKNSPVPGCRLWYLGCDKFAFAAAFADLGAIRAPLAFTRETAR